MVNHITAGMKPEVYDLWGEMVILTHERLQQEKLENHGVTFAVKRRERYRQYGRRYHVVRSQASKQYEKRKASLPNTLTTQQWNACLDYWQFACAVCGCSSLDGFMITADHWIPLSSPNCPGTIATNTIPLCQGVDGCNNRKGNFDPDVWLIRQYGYGHAAEIKARIQAYFAWVESEERCVTF